MIKDNFIWKILIGILNINNESIEFIIVSKSYNIELKDLGRYNTIKLLKQIYQKVLNEYSLSKNITIKNRINN